MKCPLCASRKGKRRCPAIREEICTTCCGEKRLVEIACPSDCSFLTHGRQNEIMREWEDYARHQEPEKLRRWFDVMEEMLPLVEVLEQAAADAASAVPDLSDQELAEALERLMEAYSSEDNGILYEPASTSPRVHLLIRNLRKQIEDLRESVKTEEEGELPLKAIIECLRVFADRVGFHRSRQVAPLINHLRRTRKLSHTGARPDSSPLIIVP